MLVADSIDQLLDALDTKRPPEILAGGTDFMVEVNFGRRRPESVVATRKISKLSGWHLEPGERRWVVMGANLTYAEMLDDSFAKLVPALAQAARTVGSPQIRNAGTLAGNIGTASPAGDTLPVLFALGAEVEIKSPGSVRNAPIEQVVVGPKRTSLASDEVVSAIRVPGGLGSQEFLKVGTRNAMVIAVATVALVVDWEGQKVRCAMGSVGPLPLRAEEAEQFAQARIDFSTGQLEGGPADLERFGKLASAAARPIDDHRSTADYRRHAVAVCARRALARALGQSIQPKEVPT